MGPYALLAALIAAGVGYFQKQIVRYEEPPRATQAQLDHRKQEQAANAARGDEIQGRVVKVSDGDTITILTSAKEQIKIRLLGIDAPEKSQPFGNVCREKLADQVAGKEVIVRVASHDRYGRTVGKVLVNGKDANLAQVQEGCAWHYKQFVKNQEPQDRELYAQSEIKARKERKGLWKDPRPEEPWEYRREHRR